MSKQADNNQPQVVHPPYEFALTLLVIQQNDAANKKDSIADLWDYESVGEAVHMDIDDARELDVPVLELTGVYPMVLVYDNDLEHGYDDPLFTSDDLFKVRKFIQNFEDTHKV